MKIAIRTDASLQIGIGHVMRCLTLAEELRSKGAKVVFVCREHSGHLCKLVMSKGFEVNRLNSGSGNKHCQVDCPQLAHAPWLGATQSTDVDQTIRALQGNAPWDWIIVDHYALDYRWESAIRQVADRIMAIDDLADRKHDCDLLLDQNFSKSLESRYNNLTMPQCKKLLGPEYALLRSEFRESRKLLRERDGNVKRIMIFFGGVDPSNETLKVLQALKTIKQTDIVVDIVLGANNSRRKAIEIFAASMPNFQCYFNVTDMAKLMVVSDVFIGSAGTTTWERCCLGLPSLVITTAWNQEKATIDLADFGALYYLGKSEQLSRAYIKNRVDYFLCRPSHLVDCSNVSMNLVDGNGAERCVSLLNNILNL